MTQLASLGRIVHYVSRNGDGVVSPAIVVRTKADTNLDIIERWGPDPEGTLSGKGRPADLKPELEEDEADLCVFGLGGLYYEYAVPFHDVDGSEYDARTWHWPPRV